MNKNIARITVKLCQFPKQERKEYKLSGPMFSRGNICVNKAALLAMYVMLFSLPVFGDYEIDWYTIDGGGGLSSGGQYVVMGTAAQHDAASSAGDQYELLGGFWTGEPSCFVDLEDFARFAQYWLDTGTDLPADLYKDQYDIVDYLDLQIFAAEWLWYCPYNWQLK